MRTALWMNRLIFVPTRSKERCARVTKIPIYYSNKAVLKSICVIHLSIMLYACDSGATEETVAPSPNQSGSIQSPVDLGAASEQEPAEERYKPAVDSSWQWQLQGSINTGYDVDVYDIDLFDTPAQTFQQLQSQGKGVICYFSAGTFENWRTDAGAFPAEAIGTALGDFPAERWIDIRSEPVRQVMRARLELAKQRGCDAVEPDNVDGYTQNSGFTLTASDQLDYNAWLALTAHELGLGVGLKNDTDQVLQLVDAFDFAVTEQCFEYDECERYTPFIDAGKPVFNTEYPPLPIADAQSFIGLCEESARLGLATLIMPILLDDSFRIDCADVVR